MRKGGHLGWKDPVDQFLALQTAIRILAEGKSNFRIRMEKATFPLTKYLPQDFPERIRNRALEVLGTRRKVRKDYGQDALFHFERLKSKQRTRLTKNIISLYEACLMDIGKMNMDSLYPKDVTPE
jgi:hypothetical protein